MSKINTVVMSPYSVQAGYGAHARDIISCLYKIGNFNLTLIPLNGGNCPMNALKASNPMHQKMQEDLIKEQLTSQPDLFIHITIPPEFQRIGKKNIGITAGIESDRVSQQWLQKSNNMDLIIVPSNHSKHVHDSSKYQVRNKNGQTVQTLENQTDIEVLFEGVDKIIYNKVNTKNLKDKHPLSNLNDIPEDFNFLVSGHGMSKGGLRDDRKDIGGAIYNFIKTFHYQKGEVGLVLKVSGPTFSLLDRERIKKDIRKIRNKFPDIDKQPNIYLVHGNLSNKEMNQLYNLEKIKAMYSCTHGEGYGRPLAEFIVATGKPVFATGWSGQVDFITDRDFLFDYELKEIPDSAVWDNILIKGSKWAYVNDNDVQNKLNYCYHNYDKLLEKSQKLRSNIRNDKSLKDMQNNLEEILEKYKPAVQQNIVLPNDIDMSKLRKIDDK